jgi:hypothetical protein
MTTVLDIVQPVQLLKQIVSKTGCFHLSVRVKFLRGPKKEQEIVSSLDEGNRSIV